MMRMEIGVGNSQKSKERIVSVVKNKWRNTQKMKEHKKSKGDKRLNLPGEQQDGSQRDTGLREGWICF